MLEECNAKSEEYYAFKAFLIFFNQRGSKKKNKTSLCCKGRKKPHLLHQFIHTSRLFNLSTNKLPAYEIVRFYNHIRTVTYLTNAISSWVINVYTLAKPWVLFSVTPPWWANSSHSNSSPELLNSSFRWNTIGPDHRPLPSMSGLAPGKVWLSKLRNCNLQLKPTIYLAFGMA